MNILDEYHDLIREFETLITDDELCLKFKKLNITERNILLLYIACNYKIGILARLLHTNSKYAKKLVNDIQIKMKESL